VFLWPGLIISTQLTHATIDAGLSFVFSTILSPISFYILEQYIAGKVGSLFVLPIDLKTYKKSLLVSFACLTIVGLGI
ncbi:acetyltransferase, partial [Streptococcus suis]